MVVLSVTPKSNGNRHSTNWGASELTDWVSFVHDLIGILAEMIFVASHGLREFIVLFRSFQWQGACSSSVVQFVLVLFSRSLAVIVCFQLTTISGFFFDGLVTIELGLFFIEANRIS